MLMAVNGLDSKLAVNVPIVCVPKIFRFSAALGLQLTKRLLKVLLSLILA